MGSTHDERDGGGGGGPGPGGTTMYLPRMARISYDYRNQMVKIVYTDSSEQTYVHTYSYDCFGRRIRKVTYMQPDGPANEWTTNGVPDTGGETRYIHGGPADDAHWQVLEEYGGQFGLAATYVYGNYIDEVLTVRRGALDFYFHQDDLFSTTSVTAGPDGIAGGALYYGSPAFAAGAVVERYEYGDFGLPRMLDAGGTPRGPWSAFWNSRLFTGREWEPEIEFYYYRTRYMEPTWGRFTTRDTIGIWGDLKNTGNGGTYVASSPSTHTDPFGRTFYDEGPKIPGTPIQNDPSANTIVCRGGRLEVQNNNNGPDRSCTQIHEEEHIKDWKRRYGDGLCKGVQDGYIPIGGSGYDEFKRKSECRAYRAGKKCRERLVKSCIPGDKQAIEDAIKRDNDMLKAYRCN